MSTRLGQDPLFERRVGAHALHEVLDISPENVKRNIQRSLGELSSAKVLRYMEVEKHYVEIRKRAAEEVEKAENRESDFESFAGWSTAR